MQITPPQKPSRATGELEKLLGELGHPAITELDNERQSLADNHDDLFEEVAAFARRGWAFAFDAETGMGYDPQDYEQTLAEILRPLGITTVTFDEAASVIEVDGRTIAVESPEQDDDWLDISWIFDVANLALSETTWQLVAVDDSDPHQVIVGTVPQTVWSTICDRELRGSWRAIAVVEPGFN